MAVEQELESVQRELARFERRAGMVWLAGLAAAVIVVVLWGAARQAQSQSTSLAARQVVLVDLSDRPRIILASDTNNRPGIWIRDEAGKDRLRVGFGTQPVSPFIFLADEAGRVRLAAGFNVEHGDPQMGLLDPAGTSRAFFGFGVQLRTPQLVLDDEHGKDRIYAGWTREGAATLHVTDDAGKIVWKTGDTPGGTVPGAGSGGRTPANTPKPPAP